MATLSSQYPQHYNTKAAALPTVLKQLTHTTISQSVIQNTSSVQSHWGPTMTVGTDNEHMVNLHHWEWHFVTPACEQLHYFIWQSITTYCSHKSMYCEQHNLL